MNPQIHLNLALPEQTSSPVGLGSHSQEGQAVQVRSKERSSNPNHDLGHLEGFDYLRVFFMMMVLLAHGDFFWNFGSQRQAAVGAGPNLWDLLYYHIQSTAVPSFILMSMLLFSIKPPTWERAVDRIKKLAYLYGFWVAAWILYTKLRPAPGLYGLFEFVIRGGGWVLYTFTVLMIMTPLCCVAHELNKKAKWLGPLLGILVVVGTFAYLTQGQKWSHRHYYWVPTCFTMMPFVAVLMVPHLKYLRATSAARWKWIGIMLLVAFVCALIEWRFSLPNEMVKETGWRNWLPKHARLSIQFTAVALVIASLGVKTLANSWVRFFAKNSLGIYCLHPFVLRGIMVPVKRIVDPIAPELSIIAGCVTVAIVCALISEFLRRAFRQRLI
jgi:surface polysaccharide O-acyltransferase-like enzyme